jgi:prepilin-type N-terminal cleavage/methylation domain-containing protein
MSLTVIKEEMKMRRTQKGFTLIELVIALAIVALFMGFLTSAIIQVITINTQNTNHITVQRQVQQAGFYISQDCQQARTITLGSNPTGTGFPIVLTRIELDGRTNQVTYSLNAAGVISRSESVGGGPTSTIVVASNINTSATLTAFTKFSTNVYSLKITASIPGRLAAQETRKYEILLRTSS